MLIELIERVVAGRGKIITEGQRALGASTCFHRTDKRVIALATPPNDTREALAIGSEGERETDRRQGNHEQ